MNNGMGCVLANREDEKEALPYLQENEKIYEKAMMACEVDDKSLIFKSLKLSPLDQFLLKRPEEDPEAEQVVQAIHAGFDLNYIEASYTQTLFFLAQVY